MTKLLATIALSCVLLAGCAQTGGDSSAKEREAEGSAPTGNPPAGGTTTGGAEVGAAFAEVELRPVGDSDVSGNVVFKEVGSLGVQVELEVSGLPTAENSEEPEEYFAQVHGGSCSEAPQGGGREPEGDHGDEPHGHEHEHGGAGPTLALLGPGPLSAEPEEYADHPEYEPPPADELPGDVDTPVQMGASADGRGTVTSLLEGVEPEQLTSGGPRYIDLRAPSHDAPERWPALACADLGEEQKVGGEKEHGSHGQSHGQSHDQSHDQQAEDEQHPIEKPCQEEPKHLRVFDCEPMAMVGVVYGVQMQPERDRQTYEQALARIDRVVPDELAIHVYFYSGKGDYGEGYQNAVATVTVAGDYSVGQYGKTAQPPFDGKLGRKDG